MEREYRLSESRYNELMSQITELKAEIEQRKSDTIFYKESADSFQRVGIKTLAKLTKAEDILKERDGGGHDANCKIFRMVAKCNCGHQDVLDYFKDKSY